LYDTVLSLLSALSYIHSDIGGFVASHHDIKPANIILFGDQAWKICDFGKSGLKDLEGGSETEARYGLGTRNYQPPEYEDGISKRFGRALDVWAMGCIFIELAILLVYGWETEKLQEFTKSRTKTGNPNDPFHKNLSVVSHWTERLERHDGSSNIVFLMRTARAMLHTEREVRLYSWEAYLNLYERFNPDDTVDDRRNMTEKFVQRPKDGAISSKENPRARTAMVNNSICDECLANKGWPPAKSTSPEIESFLHKCNSKPKRADIEQLFTFIHEGYGLTKEQKDLALEFAEAILPVDITFSETIALLQKSRAWSFKEPLEYRMNVIKVLKGEMKVNHKDPTEMTPLCWAARYGNAVAARFLLVKGAEIDHKNASGHTPLTIASFMGHDNVVKVLLHHGNLDINSRGNDLRTPLSHAAQWAHVEVVKILLDHGANPRIQGFHGRTSISMAATCPKREVLETLLEHGNVDTRTKDHYGRSPLTHAKSELEYLQKKGEMEKDLGDLIANVKKLEEREPVDDKAVKEFLQLKIHGKGY
jgi:serine/threonine protein kinase